MGKKTFKEKFKRFELKYVISKQLLTQLQQELKPYVVADEYATSTISNLYYDTDDFRIIRESLEKPNYKEKLRVRSYEAIPTKESQAFIEIKKKFQKVVYKRRITASVEQAAMYLAGDNKIIADSQIKEEINWLIDRHNELKPKMYIYYDRYSMKGIEDPNVRITIDHNLLYRDYDLRLDSGVYGEHLLDPDYVIMEIKIPGAFPLWLSELLTKYSVYKSSFSKYGTAYQKVKILGGKEYVQSVI